MPLRSIFDYFRLADLLDDIRKEFCQADLARKLDMTPQRVNLVLKGRHHLLYPDARAWAAALKLRRIEGDYLELLAILSAYPHTAPRERRRMFGRLFHLAGRLEGQINPSLRPSDSLIYWLDPLFSVVRNLVELTDFPKNEKEIPAWASGRIAYPAAWGAPNGELPHRIREVWRWLRTLNAVVWSAERGRFVKSEPTILSAGRIREQASDIHSAILVLSQVATHNAFAALAGGGQVLSDRLATLSISGKALPSLDRLFELFLYDDVLRRLNYVTNRDDRERLRQTDPEGYAEVLDFMRRLAERGCSFPDGGDADVDTTIEILLAARRLTRNGAAADGAEADTGEDES